MKIANPCNLVDGMSGRIVSGTLSSPPLTPSGITLDKIILVVFILRRFKLFELNLTERETNENVSKTKIVFCQRAVFTLVRGQRDYGRTNEIVAFGVQKKSTCVVHREYKRVAHWTNAIVCRTFRAGGVVYLT